MRPTRASEERASEIREQPAQRLTLLLIARVPPGGIDAFDAYERAVLPVLAEHGGLLERRLRGLDDLLEAHVVSFPDEASLAAYRADPRRAAAAPLLAASGAEVDLRTVVDVRG